MKRSIESTQLAGWLNFYIVKEHPAKKNSGKMDDLKRTVDDKGRLEFDGRSKGRTSPFASICINEMVKWQGK